MTSVIRTTGVPSKHVTSARPASLDRMMGEYDGLYPGVSMHDLVARHTIWKCAAEKRWPVTGLNAEQAIFKGTGNSFSVGLKTARWLTADGYTKLHFHSSLRVTFEGSSMNGCPTTIVRCSDGNYEGHSGFRLVTDYGFEDNRYCVVSTSVVGAISYLTAKRKEADKSESFDPKALARMVGSQMWLARLALWFAIDWEKCELPKVFPSVETTSQRYADVMNQRLKVGPLYVSGGL